MASDPTDLIREADEALAQEARDEGGPIVDDPADLVRRLRDALATAQDDNRTLADAYQSEHDRSLRLAIRAAGADEVLAQRDELRAALAEANATIERVEATCDDLNRMNQDTPGMPHANYNREIRRNVVARIRRAIEGEP